MPSANTCTAGELALVSSKLFQDHSLRLYRYICVNNESVEYMVVAEQASILGIKLVNNENTTLFRAGSAAGLPICQFPREHMRTGMVGKLLSVLSNLLNGPPQVRLPFPDVHLISVEQHAKMAKLHMIHRQEDYIWEPTPYGLSLGVIDGYVDRGDGRPCHTFFVLPRYKSKLDIAMSWVQLPPAPFRSQLSWDQTLKRACRGLPRSDSHAASVVRDFASLPLSDYMASNEKELEVLRREFGELSTYQEAADHIFRLCMNCDKTQTAQNRCIDLIFALSLPVFQALNTTKRPVR